MVLSSLHNPIVTLKVPAGLVLYHRPHTSHRKLLRTLLLNPRVTMCRSSSLNRRHTVSQSLLVSRAADVIVYPCPTTDR